MARLRMTSAVLLSLGLVLSIVSDVSGQLFSRQPAPDTGDMEPTAGQVVADERADGVKQVGWFSLPMPKISMPKITMPQLPPLWPTGKEGEKPALLSPFVSGVNKITDGTKKAWHGTKEVFAVGKGKAKTESAPSTATRSRPSFLKRLFGGEPEPQGPQTVGEFMSQKRLDP